MPCWEGVVSPWPAKTRSRCGFCWLSTWNGLARGGVRPSVRALCSRRTRSFSISGSAPNRSSRYSVEMTSRSARSMRSFFSAESSPRLGTSNVRLNGWRNPNTARRMASSASQNSSQDLPAVLQPLHHHPQADEVVGEPGCRRRSSRSGSAAPPAPGVDGSPSCDVYFSVAEEPVASRSLVSTSSSSGPQTRSMHPPPTLFSSTSASRREDLLGGQNGLARSSAAQPPQPDLWRDCAVEGRPVRQLQLAGASAGRRAAGTASAAPTPAWSSFL
jgi:hypothetical protein